jgi:hypothetical protein
MIRYTFAYMLHMRSSTLLLADTVIPMEPAALSLTPHLKQ